MNINITISEESYRFIKDFMQKVNSQDNRATASPFYYTVCCKEEVAVPEGCGKGTKYHDSGACENYTEKDLREYCKENDEEFDEYVENNCTVYDWDEREIHEEVFFTEEGYNEHMRLNEHNYRYYKDHYSYVKHAFRNPELTGLFKALGEISEEGWNKH